MGRDEHVFRMTKSRDFPEGVQLHVAGMTHSEGKMVSFGVQLHKDFNVAHLYCVDHNIHLTSKLACMCDDK